MSDLDDKLSEILEDVSDFSHDGEYIGDKNVVAQIKQAFADTGYIRPGRHETVNQRLREKVVNGELMTGQGWYDRFQKDLIYQLGTTGQLHARDSAMMELVLKAAKRAAGIE